jgi:hypothetical protein
MRYKTTKEELEKAVKESLSIAGVCRFLNIRPVGGNYKTLHEKIKTWEIDTSHFTGMGWNVGLKFRPKQPITLDKILCGEVDYRSTVKLRQRLIKEGIKNHVCEICKLTEWLGNPIKLELHHIDGDNTNNKIENLQLLCPNCHANTDNFRRGKTAINEKRKLEYDEHKNDIKIEYIKKIPKERKPLNTHICQHCKKEFTGRKGKYCSAECYHEDISKQIPKVPELIQKFKELKSFVQVGKFYSVSDNAVKKWCISYGILDMIKED